MAQHSPRLLHPHRRRPHARELEQPRSWRRQRRIVIERPAHELTRAPIEGDPPIGQRDRAVGGRQTSLEAMLREHDGGPPFLVQPPEQADQLVAGDRIELGRRLVQQHQAGASDERRCERDPLQLAPRQRVDGPVQQVWHGERQRHLLDRPGPRRNRLRAHLQRQLELRPHGGRHHLRLRVLRHQPDRRAEVRRPVLAHVHPGHPERAHHLPTVVVRYEAAAGTQERRLARAGPSRHHHQLTRIDVDVDRGQGIARGLRIAVRDAAGHDQRISHGGSSAGFPRAAAPPRRRSPPPG
jgi:hypothetical protein